MMETMKKIVAGLVMGLGVMGCGPGEEGHDDTPISPCTPAEAGSAPFAPNANAIAAAVGASPSAMALTASSASTAVFSGLLPATQGEDFLWMSTGVAGAGTPSAVVEGATAPEDGTDFGNANCNGDGTFDCVTLTMTFAVPQGHDEIRFDFTFLSTEFPEYVGAGFGDAFRVRQTSPTFSFENISFDALGRTIGIDSAFFSAACVPETEATGFNITNGFGECDAGWTGHLATASPIKGGEEVTLTFTLHDGGDGIYDSAVMLDGLTTRNSASTHGSSAPITQECD